MSLQNIDLVNEPGFVQTEKSKGKYHNLSRTAAKIRKTLELFGTAIGGIFFIPALSGGLILWLVLANDIRSALFALLGLALSFSIAHILSLDDNRLNLSRILQKAERPTATARFLMRVFIDIPPPKATYSVETSFAPHQVTQNQYRHCAHVSKFRASQDRFAAPCLDQGERA